MFLLLVQMSFSWVRRIGTKIFMVPHPLLILPWCNHRKEEIPISPIYSLKHPKKGICILSNVFSCPLPFPLAFSAPSFKLTWHKCYSSQCDAVSRTSTLDKPI